MCQHQAHFSNQHVFADYLQNGSLTRELLNLLKRNKSNVCSPFLVDFANQCIQGKRYTPKTVNNILFRILQNEGTVMFPMSWGGYCWWMITGSGQWLTGCNTGGLTVWSEVQCGDFKGSLSNLFRYRGENHHAAGTTLKHWVEVLGWMCVYHALSRIMVVSWVAGNVFPTSHNPPFIYHI